MTVCLGEASLPYEAPSDEAWQEFLLKKNHPKLKGVKLHTHPVFPNPLFLRAPRSQGMAVDLMEFIVPLASWARGAGQPGSVGLGQVPPPRQQCSVVLGVCTGRPACRIPVLLSVSEKLFSALTP